MPKFFDHEQYRKQRFVPDEEDALKTLVSWKAPSRPYHKKDRSYYTTIAVIVVLLALIAFIAQEYLLIGVIMALAFVSYVLAFVPPEDVEYKISTQGITIGDHFYFWHLLDSFWIAEKEGQSLVAILTEMRFPGQLMLMLGGQDQEETKKIIAKYLPYHEVPPKTTLDRWAESLQRHFPLENPHR